ncbi:MAG TPA: DUF190 domain-containing protein [Gallionella sp.]|nr:DUF190 domain-containing protein [Gallionella sp.]
MNSLIFYAEEKQTHAGMLFYEWLLKEARELGVHGGSVFRAIAGFGRHDRLNEEPFFEPAGELAVKVEFILDDKLADQLLQRVKAQGMAVFYTRYVVQSGII